MLLAAGLVTGSGCSDDDLPDATTALSTTPIATTSIADDATSTAAPSSSTATSASIDAPAPSAGSAPEGNVPPAEVVPFVDEFDDDRHGWGGPDQRFEGGAYVWDLPSGQSDSRSPDTLIAVEDQLTNLEITTSFTAIGALGVGIECAYEQVGGSARWYLLELAVDGARIRRQPLGTDPVETLGENPDVALTTEPAEIAATCVLDETDRYRLTLVVNGTVAVEATDDEPFGRAGAPNLAVRAAADSDDAPEHTVRFDRVAVRPAATG